MNLFAAIREAVSSLREPAPLAKADTSSASAEEVRLAQEHADAEREAQQALFNGVERCQSSDFEQAIGDFQSAYVIYVKIADRKSAALCMKIMSLLFAVLKDPAFVKRTFQRAEDQLRKAGLKDEAARVIMLRARYEASESNRHFEARDYKASKDGYKVAVASYKEARKAYQALSSIDGEMMVVLEWAELEASKADKCSAAKLVSEIIDAAGLMNRHDVKETARAFAKRLGL